MEAEWGRGRARDRGRLIALLAFAAACLLCSEAAAPVRSSTELFNHWISKTRAHMDSLQPAAMRKETVLPSIPVTCLFLFKWDAKKGKLSFKSSENACSMHTAETR
jgi:hypothetical protein